MTKKNDDIIGMAIAGGLALLLGIFGIKMLSGSGSSQPPATATGRVGISNHATSSGCNKCPFS